MPTDRKRGYLQLSDQATELVECCLVVSHRLLQGIHLSLVLFQTRTSANQSRCHSLINQGLVCT